MSRWTRQHRRRNLRRALREARAAVPPPPEGEPPTRSELRQALNQLEASDLPDSQLVPVPNTRQRRPAKKRKDNAELPRPTHAGPSYVELGRLRHGDLRGRVSLDDVALEQFAEELS